MKPARFRFSDLPMTGKLVALMIFASFIPMMIVTVFCYNRTYQAMLDKTRESMLLSAQSSSRQIERQLDSYYQTISSLYTDNSLRAYLTEDYESDYDFVVAYQYIDQLMYRTIASAEGIKHIQLYVDNATLPKDAFFVKDYALAKTAHPWLLEADNAHEGVVVSPVTMDESGRPVVCFGRVMDYHQQGYAYAYLVMEIWVDHLTELLADLDDACLLDSANRLIGATEQQGISAHIAAQGTPATGVNWMDVSAQGEACLAVRIPLGQQWQVVHAVPLNTITAPARSNTAGILIIYLVCTAASLAVISMIIHYFTGRIRVILKQISQIESKDYAVHQEVSGRDELARVSQAVNTMAQGMQQAIDEIKTREKQRRHMQLSLLQSQINPHFLYNSLAGVSALALRNGDEEAHRMAGHLAQFYKLSLSRGKDVITLAEEIQIARHYLVLQNMRFRDRFITAWHIDEQLLDCTVPKLILQPFIENIVDHALRPDEQPLHVGIRVCEEGGCLCMEITDDGIGIEPDRLRAILEEPHSTGYGIHNVADRIRLMYGEQGKLQITSVPGEGTTVVLRIPCPRS